MRNTTRTTIAMLTAGALALGLAACGGGDQTAQEDGPATLTLWSWDPVLPYAVKQWNKENPDIQIKTVNAGSGDDEYTALSNAIAAGKGAPDLVLLNADAVAQFAVQGALVDLAPYGADKVVKGLTAGAKNDVLFDGKMYIYPLGTGPMAMYYDQETLDKAGVDPAALTTWDAYYEAAKKVHALGDDYYITTDSGSDAGFLQQMFWAAGAEPFAVDNEYITINLTGDKTVRKVAEYWQRMIDEGLIDTKTNAWTDEWFRGMDEGKTATLLTGSWMPINFKNSVPNGKGKWGVMPLPSWDESRPTSAEAGGGGIGIVKGTKYEKQAAKFLEYVGVGEGSDIREQHGDFPNSIAKLDDQEWLERKDDYFMGQQINEVFAQSARNVKTTYQWLPYQVHAGSIFPDTVGAAYSNPGKTTIMQGLKAWQDKLVDYGNDQGYAVNK